MYEIVWANLGECFSLDWRKLYSFWGHFEITLGSLHLHIHNLSLGLYLLHMSFIDSFQFSILHIRYAFSSNEHLFKSFLLLLTLIRYISISFVNFLNFLIFIKYIVTLENVSILIKCAKTFHIEAMLQCFILLLTVALWKWQETVVILSFVFLQNIYEKDKGIGEK